ncbi:alpha/beta-hydrolase [Wolfiporia cocos MD-104 SS10]|uniref:Alpha/beta-hydrolase n=1 Tax=Wolfiporia cocos (strain MD-104) TaxID=742152 RepID=A0A2H3JPY5_WOLCO|nr:alpha/beta-hydrolase [Wolfiporia cocos MD-104 SS10]
MVYELRQQLLKSIYLAIQNVTTYLVRFPIWFLTSLPRFLRPRRSWSFKKTFYLKYNRFYSEFGPIASRVGPLRAWPTYHSIPDIPGVKGIWLSPVPHLVVGDVKKWAEAAGVESVKIPGYWIDKAGHDTPIGEKPASGEKVVLYLHGGGLMSESAHPHSFMSIIPLSIMSQCASTKRALSVEYRLCEITPPANPFPTAIIDILAGYYYLIDIVGFAAEDIIIIGDSAGGHLALAFARYLVDNALELSSVMKIRPDPPSYSMILLSPWADLGTSHLTPGSPALTLSCDFLPDLRTGVLGALPDVYAADLGHDALESNPYLSPASLHLDAHSLFEGFPRTFIDAGNAERFVGMCRTLKDRMVADLGEDKVTYCEPSDALHDHLLNPFEEDQNLQTLREISAWLA